MSDQLIVDETMNWVRSFVIALNICPFAKHVVDAGSLVIEVIHTNEFALSLERVMSAIGRLEASPEIETMLLVYPYGLHDFLDYLDFADLAERLLVEQGYDGIYQMATFHPHYCFADVDADDVSHYTNRSPYPMLHLLRENSLDQAIAYYGDTDKIPTRNIETMHKLGLQSILNLLKTCGFDKDRR